MTARPGAPCFTLHFFSGHMIFIVGTIIILVLSFDPEKSRRNEVERGFAFSIAADFDWSTALVVEDTRKDYTERRYQALGLIHATLHMLVFTPRQEVMHVISLRRANRRERTRYAAQTKP